jgi:hypothetical protein
VRPDEIVGALDPVADALDRLGVRYYVGGSLASSVRGAPRASIDVDVAAELRPEHVRPLVESLSDGYYVSEERVRDAVAGRRSFNLIHLASMLKVDVFVSRQRPFDRAAFDRLTREPLDAAGTSRPYPVPCAEDVILLKLEWFRAGGEVSDRQWGDILGVSRAVGASLDRGHLARWAEELGVGDLLERALAESGLDPAGRP